MKIVFAYHSEDPVSPTEVKYHEFRGVKSILLLSSVDTRKTNVTGWKTFNMTARNVRKTLLKSIIIVGLDSPSEDRQERALTVTGGHLSFKCTPPKKNSKRKYPNFFFRSSLNWTVILI